MPKSTVPVKEVEDMEIEGLPSTDATTYSNQRSLSSTSQSSSIRHSSEASPGSTSPSRGQDLSHGSFSVSLSSDYSNHGISDPDAPPAKRGKRSGDIQDIKEMSKRDYAIEMSRIMGKQLVKGLNGKDPKIGQVAPC